jgi:hypothetical protein
MAMVSMMKVTHNQVLRFFWSNLYSAMGVPGFEAILPAEGDWIHPPLRLIRLTLIMGPHRRAVQRLLREVISGGKDNVLG